MTEPSRGRLSRHLPTLWLGSGLALGFLLALFPLINTDIWWHLAAGRRIVEQAAFLYEDPFSISAAGRAWIDLHWLFQLAAYVVHAVGGIGALVWVKALLVGAGVLLLVLGAEQAAGKSNRALLVAGTLIGIVPVRHLILARPIIVTLLLLAGFFFVLERVRAGGDRRLLWLLPLLQIVWANCQGLHPLGPVVVACYLIAVVVGGLLVRSGVQRFDEGFTAASVRLLPWVLVACIAAACVSPYGFDAWRLPLRLFARIDPAQANLYALNVSENAPHWLLARQSPLQAAFLPLLALVTLASFLLAGRRVLLSRLLVAVAMLVLASMAHRNLLLAAWLCAPIAAANLAWWAAHERPRGHVIAWLHRIVRGPVVAGTAMVLVAALAVISVARQSTLFELAPFRVPTQTTALLRGLPGGAVFSSVRYGGYLIWQLHPKHVPYIDGRLVLRSPQEFAELLSVVDNPTLFETFRDRHDFQYVAVPTAYPDRYRRLAAHLVRHPAWSLLATDGTETLFAYQSPADVPTVTVGDSDTSDRILAGLRRRYAKQPKVLVAATHNLAAFLVAAGYATEARRVLAPLDDLMSRSLVARCYYLEGDLHLAETLAREVLSEDEHDVSSLNLLARVAIDRGEPRQALALLRRVLDIDPYNTRGSAMLLQLEHRVEAGP